MAGAAVAGAVVVGAVVVGAVVVGAVAVGAWVQRLPIMADTRMAMADTRITATLMLVLMVMIPAHPVTVTADIHIDATNSGW